MTLAKHRETVRRISRTQVTSHDTPRLPWPPLFWRGGSVMLQVYMTLMLNHTTALDRVMRRAGQSSQAASACPRSQLQVSVNSGTF